MNYLVVGVDADGDPMVLSAAPTEDAAKKLADRIAVDTALPQAPSIYKLHLLGELRSTLKFVRPGAVESINWPVVLERGRSLSSRELARRLGCHQKTVATKRRRLGYITCPSGE